MRSAVGGSVQQRDKYQLLYVGDGARAARPGTEADVQAGTTADSQRQAHTARAFEPGSRSRASHICIGAQRRPTSIRPSTPIFAVRLRRRTLCDILRTSAVVRACLSLLVQLPFAIRKDIRRRKELKYGRRLKGPVLLTPKQFNKTVKGDGIGFKTTEAKEMMRIPLQAEAQHIESWATPAPARRR